MTLLRKIKFPFNYLKLQNPIRLQNIVVLRAGLNRNHIRIATLATTVAILYYKQNIRCIEDSILQNARNKIESEITKMKHEYGLQMASYPTVIYSTRGPKYSLEFLFDQRICDIFTVLTTILDVLGRGSESNDFKVIKIDSMKDEGIYTMQVQFTEAIGNPKNRLQSKGTIYISGEMIKDRPNFKLVLEKQDEISDLDIQAFVASYREAIKPRDYYFLKRLSNENQPKLGQGQSQSNQQQTTTQTNQEAIKKLEELGVTIFQAEQKFDKLDWDYLAGYEKQKRDIEDTVLLALQFPDIYDEISKGTRIKNEPNRPKAVLFEGPPGTGKTTSAKIIAQQVKIPLVYMPIETILSKYYGESEKRFADIWDACIKIGKCIIFIDEIDAIAQSRDSEMHEASRRILSTLLRKIDSFESTTNVLLICATNRKQDLDAAMLSRLDLSIKFELPDELSRAAIFQRYAKHLSDDERRDLANHTMGMSGRNIADVCKDAERRWASKLIRKETNENLPNTQQYIETIKNRQSSNLI